MHAAALVALLALAAPEAAPPPAAAEAQDPTARRDPDTPPDGTPEDRELWRALREAGIDAVAEMSRVAQGAYRLRYGRYYQELDARITSAEGDERSRASAMRERLSAAARQADGAIPKKGLRVRRCKYVHLDLEQRMDLLDDPRIAAELGPIRQQARRCLEEVGGLARKVKPYADALEAAIEETDLLLGRARPAVPKAPASEAPAAGM